MRTAILILMAGVSLAACAPFEEPLPTSADGWQRRQDGMEQRHRDERERLCRITEKEDPRYEQLCRGVEGAAQ